MNISSWDAVILAGGRSRRMGQCKALLTVEGKTMVERTKDALSDFSRIFLSANDPALSCGLPVVQDIFPGCGPLAGLHAALSATDKEGVFSVSCDLPHFSPRLPRLLLEKMPEDAQVMICRDSTGRLHPHCGLYRKSVLPLLESCLSAGEFKVMDFIHQVPFALLDTEELLPDEVFFNMNTPEDYRAVKAPSCP